MNPSPGRWGGYRPKRWDYEELAGRAMQVLMRLGCVATPNAVIREIQAAYLGVYGEDLTPMAWEQAIYKARKIMVRRDWIKDVPGQMVMTHHGKQALDRISDDQSTVH